MNLKEPFKDEKISKKTENGKWIIFQHSPFTSSIITSKRILYTTENEDEAGIALVLLKAWQEMIVESYEPTYKNIENEYLVQELTHSLTHDWGIEDWQDFPPDTLRSHIEEWIEESKNDLSDLAAARLGFEKFMGW